MDKSLKTYTIYSSNLPTPRPNTSPCLRVAHYLLLNRVSSFITSGGLSVPIITAQSRCLLTWLNHMAPAAKEAAKKRAFTKYSGERQAIPWSGSSLSLKPSTSNHLFISCENLKICLFVYFVCFFVCLICVCLFTLFACLFTCLFVCLFTLFVHFVCLFALFVCFLLCLINLFVCLFTFLVVCLLTLFACLFV